MVTDYYRGGDLQNRIEKLQLPSFSEDQIHEFAIKIAEGLNYLHNRGVIHRDLKPDNILLSSDVDISAPVICDFGFSRRLQNGKTCSQICGTKGYMAPEILAHRPYSFPVDIWSFGVMLYVLIAVKLPFPVPNDALNERNVHVAYNFIVNSEVSLKGPEWDNVSDALKGLLLGMLEKDPLIRLNAEAVLNHPWMNSKSSLP